MDATAPELQQVKQAMRTAWMAGDFGVIARTIVKGAEAFVERLPLAPNSLVLDVACGTGNLAIPIARRGARVTGLDIVPNLLVQGRARAAEEGLSIQFDEGDAEQLPYPDAHFDAVVTMFGAMFAPRPAVVASELARVLRPGGLLAMANWNPASFTGAMFRTTAKHVPPPAGIPPPALWGDEATVRERLAPFFTEIQTTLQPIDFDLPASPSGVVQFFRDYFGPTQVAFKRLDPAGQTALAADLEALWATHNTSTDPNRTLVHNQYLEVRATRF
jgi:SAM-dependent methyltransferase